MTDAAVFLGGVVVGATVVWLTAALMWRAVSSGE